MATYTWKMDVVQTVQCFEKATTHPGPTGSLILSAVWAVDSLYYLVEIVDRDINSVDRNQPHNPATKDVAHARWATSSVITALDLCAAAIARHLHLQEGSQEFDLKQLAKSNPPPDIDAWIRSIKNDARYRILKGARNPFTHAVVSGHFRSTGPNDMKLEIKEDKNKVARFSPYELVTMSKEFATEKVEEFLSLISELGNAARK